MSNVDRDTAKAWAADTIWGLKSMMYVLASTLPNCEQQTRDQPFYTLSLRRAAAEDWHLYGSDVSLLNKCHLDTTRASLRQACTVMHAGDHSAREGHVELHNVRRAC